MLVVGKVFHRLWRQLQSEASPVQNKVLVHTPTIVGKLLVSVIEEVTQTGPCMSDVHDQWVHAPFPL